MKGATIYIVGINADGTYASGEPCLLCRRMIKNAMIENVVYIDSEGEVVSFCESVVEATLRDHGIKTAAGGIEMTVLALPRLDNLKPTLQSTVFKTMDIILDVFMPNPTHYWNAHPTNAMRYPICY